MGSWAFAGITVLSSGHSIYSLLAKVNSISALKQSPPADVGAHFELIPKKIRFFDRQQIVILENHNARSFIKDSEKGHLQIDQH